MWYAQPYYTNQKYRIILHGTPFLSFLRFSRKREWDTADDVLMFNNDELARHLSDGKVIPVFSDDKYAPQYITRRGWERKKDWLIQKFKDNIYEHPDQYSYLGINTISDYEQEVEKCLQDTTRKLEGKLNLNKKYFFLMEAALQSYKPKKNWLEQRVYSLKMWLLRKLMGHQEN